MNDEEESPISLTLLAALIALLILSIFMMDEKRHQQEQFLKTLSLSCDDTGMVLTDLCSADSSTSDLVYHPDDTSPTDQETRHG